MSGVLENFAERLLKAEDQDEVFALLHETLLEDGFNNLLLSTYSDNGPKVLKGILPQDWARHYHDCELWRIDPEYQSQRTADFPHTWKSSVPQDPAPKVVDFLENQKDAGLDFGYTVPISLTAGRVNFAISSSQKLTLGIEEKMMAKTFLLSAAVTAKITMLERKDPSMRVSAREHELIKWLAAGLSNAEIGEKMGIKVKTVEEFLRRISVRNNISGRIQIATSAILSGLIDIQ